MVSQPLPAPVDRTQLDLVAAVDLQEETLLHVIVQASDGKPGVVHQAGNVLRVAVLVDQVVLGDVMDQVLHTLLVTGQCVV